MANEISQIKMPNNVTYDIKDAVARQSIAGNGTFVIAWAGTSDPSTAAAQALIPAGVKVKFGSNAERTGTLAASADTLKKFYLVKSSTLPDSETLDIYDEYVTVQGGTESSPTYSWEKIGDTQIKLSQIVTNVTLDTSKTASVIGANSTMKVTTAPKYTVTPATTYVKGTASGAAVSYSPDTDTFLKKITPSSKKLQTTSVIGVQSSTTTASKATAADSQTTAKGTGTASTSTDAWIKGWSVSNELLTLGGVTMDTQTTTQHTFADVTVPIKNTNATTVANGSLVATSTTTNVGGTIVESVTSSGTGYTANAVTSLGNPTITQPTITLSTSATESTGSAEVASPTQVNAANINVGAVGWNSKDAKTVLLNTTSITVTHAT